MNKSAIKSFAIWARNKLIADIGYKAGLLGITETEIKNPLPQSTQEVQVFDSGTKEPYSIRGGEMERRKNLAEAIRSRAERFDYATAYRNTIEEVAYAWFVRLIAVRFMEVNGYLPSRIRVLSSESHSKIEPDLVTAPFDADLDYTSTEREEILQLKHDNRLDELFRMLFIKQCNALNAVLPELFQRTNDYTELLMDLTFTDVEGVVYRLVRDIPEDDFNVGKEGQVEIIGWLYQYYNTESKDEAFALLKRNVKITKERIPAATQLFTPDWIVRYMVENSLGRLWTEGHPDTKLKARWKYYLDEAAQKPDVQAQLENIREEYKGIKPEEITVIDPCMGSGHILVYAFDVLMQIYESYGYSQHDAARSIIEYNLYGLDIDDRAYQLSYFALMMKARQYNRCILNGEIQCHVYVIRESNDINAAHLEHFGCGLSKAERDTALDQMKYVLNTMKDAKEYGSMIRIENLDWGLLQTFIEQRDFNGSIAADRINPDNTPVQLRQMVDIAAIMARKYDVVVTNPPYMGGKQGMNDKLQNYVVHAYPLSKADLCTVMMERGLVFMKETGFQAMITQQSWMFLSSYQSFRNKFMALNFTNMVHLGARAFEEIGGEVVQTVAYVLTKRRIENYVTRFTRLSQYDNAAEKQRQFFNDTNGYEKKISEFRLIPGAPFSYWLSDKIYEAYGKWGSFGSVGHPATGMMTANNDKFLRLWFEINSNEFMQTDVWGHKWIIYLKGGPFRKWYGNLDYLLKYNNDPNYILQQKNATVMKIETLQRPKCTWTDITSGKNGFRYAPASSFHDKSGHCFYPAPQDQYWLLGYANSVVFQMNLKIFNQSIHCQAGDVGKVVIPPVELVPVQKVAALAKESVDISQEDWDAFETSWEFSSHPFLIHKTTERIADAFTDWSRYAASRFHRLQSNETELNRLFIDIFGLREELSPEVGDKDVTIRKGDLGRDVRSFLSYAVGCMFGRYSLDEDGLVYAGGVWDDRKYSTFIPDLDNIIPITDEAYFEDDIVGLFCTFLEKTFGASSLEENLDFIAKALSNRGDTSREVIRCYFLKDFFKDHCRIYRKRPIYWLFDSGMSDGFKALVYMHRYHADTIGNLRNDYLHRLQRIYDSEISRMQESINDGSSAREVAAAAKREEKLTKQLKESREYDEKMAHLALARIPLNLDDGVKVNFEKVQRGSNGKILGVLAAI
ncbi:BREX-1 system adenine-specific DNA-methyltransferase PglX [Fontibacillus sp. BL9]|uniref:BREX-1 system adenine-specific DNA-methyltransferase PglX n=1 Tax=Fontibacillus sp. BL9 TaxID=3389971 RepID=UPI00397E4E71